MPALHADRRVPLQRRDLISNTQQKLIVCWPPCRVWSANGWLSPFNEEKLFDGVLGYLDYAGSSVVHATGGAAALVALIALGPRHGRFGVDGNVCELRGSVVRPLSFLATKASDHKPAMHNSRLRAPQLCRTPPLLSFNEGITL